MTAPGTNPFVDATAHARPAIEASGTGEKKWKTTLAWSSYWTVMGVSFALTAWLAEENRLGDYAWYVMAQANVVMVVVFEELIPKKKEDSLFRDGQSWNDIGHM